MRFSLIFLATTQDQDFAFGFSEREEQNIKTSSAAKQRTQEQ